MSREQVRIQTQEGDCVAHVFTPASKNSNPAVIFYMDAFAIRPALFQMAQRLADTGYIVLLPDLFYRFGAYQPLVPEEVFQGDFMSVIGPMMASTDNHRAADDTAAFLDYLDTRNDAQGLRMEAVGLCMGGGMALTAAARFPDRFAAVASFHGGNLATEQPTSPHRLFSNIKAEVYIAGADNDQTYPPEMKQRVEQALTDAGVVYRSETYAGAAHGWMKPDFPVYDEAAAERGWRELLALFHRALN